MSTKAEPQKVKELPSYQLAIPAGVEFSIDGNKITAKGAAGTITREFPAKDITISLEGSAVSINARTKSAKDRMSAGTYNSHIKNMFQGAQKPFVYELKVTFTHFPMTAALAGTDFSVQNFLGEKKPRKAKLPAGVKVAINGDHITVESPDLELAGQTATLIEQTTKVRNRDRRIYQDGIYITQKPE